jgi:hypothetical protein
MEKLQDWDALSVATLNWAKHHVKYTTSDDLVVRDQTQKSLDFAQSITGGIVVFMDLGEKDLKLATALTSKPYFSRHWNY